MTGVQTCALPIYHRENHDADHGDLLMTTEECERSAHEQKLLEARCSEVNGRTTDLTEVRTMIYPITREAWPQVTENKSGDSNRWHCRGKVNRGFPACCFSGESGSMPGKLGLRDSVGLPDSGILDFPGKW